MGFEPTTTGITIRDSDQLSYAHHNGSGALYLFGKRFHRPEYRHAHRSPQCPAMDGMWCARQGEPEQSRMHLTCIRAGERPATDGGAGAVRKPDCLATDGMWCARQDSNL